MAKPKLLMFWDYDTQWGADRSRLPGGRKNWGNLEFSNTDKLLELYADFGFRCCFAVVGAAALAGGHPYHDAAQIRRIHEYGHEVGSHSFQHEWLPALNSQQLYSTLMRSKDAIEQCLGSQVLTFVPPFNAPFDYLRAGSISMSERRTVKSQRTDLGRLCRTLAETGYKFCRVAYRPFGERMQQLITGSRIDRPGRLESIEGITCVRINTPGGFDERTVALLDKFARTDGLIVSYGHPHSLFADGAQNIRYVSAFLQRVKELTRQNVLDVCTPRQLLEQLP